jgi:Domain of unknown function (DUF397)
MDWRTSSYCAGGECAEVARFLAIRCARGRFIEVAPGVAVRDAADRGGPVLRIPPAAWRDLTRRIKAGDGA